jgi:hypothetical protein
VGSEQGLYGTKQRQDGRQRWRRTRSWALNSGFCSGVRAARASVRPEHSACGRVVYPSRQEQTAVTASRAGVRTCCHESWQALLCSDQKSEGFNGLCFCLWNWTGLHIVSIKFMRFKQILASRLPHSENNIRACLVSSY